MSTRARSRAVHRADHIQEENLPARWRRSRRKKPKLADLKKLPRFVLDWVLDRARFFIDTRPQRTAYQPLPWLGLDHARRATGTRERWEVIRPELARVGTRTAVDIGCNFGYFTFQMARQGISVIAVESEPRSVRVLAESARRMRLDNVAVLQGHLGPTSVALLPAVDAVLFLSVWHHWVRAYGLDGATRMTQCLWSKCQKALFFDTGQSEMPATYGLPDMAGDDEAWLRSYLQGIAGAGGAVRKLGTFKCFGPGGNERHAVAHRALFMIERRTWHKTG